MSMRLRNGLALLIAFFVLGTSSQAAVCDLSCALQAGQGRCHSEAGETDSQAMDMAGMHCSGSMKMPPRPQTAVSVGSHDDGVCNHQVVVAVEQHVAAGIHLIDVQWSVVDTMPAPRTRFESKLVVGKDPPLRLAAINPLFVSLRI